MNVREFYAQHNKRFPVLVRRGNRPVLWLQPGHAGQLWLFNPAGYRRLRGDEQVEDLIEESMR